jgi:hypothetical protein
MEIYISGSNGSLYVAVFTSLHFILKVLNLSSLPNMAMDEGLLCVCVCVCFFPCTVGGAYD